MDVSSIVIQNELLNLKSASLFEFYLLLSPPIPPLKKIFVNYRIMEKKGKIKF